MSKSEVREAEDPATSPARLADLAALENLPGVRERVAKNPSTDWFWLVNAETDYIDGRPVPVYPSEDENWEE